MSNNSSRTPSPILPFRQKATTGQQGPPGRQLTRQRNLTPADLTNDVIQSINTSSALPPLLVPPLPQRSPRAILQDPLESPDIDMSPSRSRRRWTRRPRVQVVSVLGNIGPMRRSSRSPSPSQRRTARRLHSPTIDMDTSISSPRSPHGGPPGGPPGGPRRGRSRSPFRGPLRGLFRSRSRGRSRSPGVISPANYLFRWRPGREGHRARTRRQTPDYQVSQYTPRARAGLLRRKMTNKLALKRGQEARRTRRRVL